MKITTQTIVKNEDVFITYALKAWEPYATKMLVIDDASTDETVKLIESLNSKKIDLTETHFTNPLDLTNARNQMLRETKTGWFLILDGDEVWDKKTIEQFLSFLEECPKSTWAVGMRTKNAIGDVYHYLDDSSGNYEILGKKGHLNIRAYKKLPGFSWQGDYPIEYYADEKGNSVNNQTDHLAFFEGHYFHFTNLKRSTVKRVGFGRRPVYWETGRNLDPSYLPEVLQSAKFTKRGISYELLARALSPLKKVKRLANGK